MSEASLTGAVRGLLWAAVGAVIALAVVYVVGVPGRQPPAGAAPGAEGNDALRARLAALEQDVANDRKRRDADRERLEAERAKPPVTSVPVPPPAAPPAAVPPPVVVVPRAPAPAKAKTPTRTAEPKTAPAPVEPARPPVEAPRPAAEAPRPAEPPPAPTKRVPSSAELLASAGEFSARGNHAQAAATLKPLADQGNAKAQSRLGQMYLEGQGVERNEQEGLRLVRSAANLGDAEAQLRMGDLCERGRGLPQNNFQAYIWYSAAVLSGNSAGSGPKARVGELLQAVEREQAGKLAAGIARQPKDR